MIEFVVRNNIDTRVLSRTADILRGGGVVAMPTDTTWVVGCSMTSKAGIKKLRAISGERDERHFTLLCSKISSFQSFCAIDSRGFRLINKYTPGPYVFILRTLHGTEKVLGLRRSELGVRLTSHPVPPALIEELGNPLYTITAKRTMDKDFEPPPDFEVPEGDSGIAHIPEESLFESGREILNINGVDMVLDTGEELYLRVSTIIDLTGAEARLLRSGAGEFPS